jgi:hypothetical protein
MIESIFADKLQLLIGQLDEIFHHLCIRFLSQDLNGSFSFQSIGVENRSICLV